MLKKIKLYGAILIVGGTLSVGGYLIWDNKSKGKHIAKLTALTEVQKVEIERRDDIIASQDKDIAKREADKTHSIQLNTTYGTQLNEAFKAEKPAIDIRILQNATINKPGLVRTLINDATDSVLQEFHDITNK